MEADVVAKMTENVDVAAAASLATVHEGGELIGFVLAFTCYLPGFFWRAIPRRRSGWKRSRDLTRP